MFMCYKEPRKKKILHYDPLPSISLDIGQKERIAW
jgi:hypothetical protein